MKNEEIPAVPDFEKEGGLVPVIAQDEKSGEILMLAWMNRDAWNLTLKSGRVVYYSRSRQRLWNKGESSGREQLVKEILLDCDRDAVVIKVEQKGDAACHTGRRSCFHHLVEDGGVRIISEPLFNPDEVYG